MSERELFLIDMSVKVIIAVSMVYPNSLIPETKFATSGGWMIFFNFQLNPLLIFTN